MITVKDVEYKFYQCESCAESEQSAGIKVKTIAIRFDESNHSSSFKLCEKCFEELKTKY